MGPESGAIIIPATFSRHEVDSGSCVQIRNLPQDGILNPNLPPNMHPACNHGREKRPWQQ
jgi:hypothetical protein